MPWSVPLLVPWSVPFWVPWSVPLSVPWLASWVRVRVRQLGSGGKGKSTHKIKAADKKREGSRNKMQGSR